MFWTVHYTKTNSFMNQKGAPKMIQTKDGEVVNESKYVRSSTPKSVRVYTPPRSYKKNTFLVNLDQKELNKLVTEIGFYDENGKLITEAPLRNPRAAFWVHKELRLSLEGRGTTLDDENPLHRFWLKCFEADRRFQFYGDKNPPSAASTIEYTVSKIGDDISEQAAASDETYEAMKLLTTLEEDFDRMVSVVRAMGVSVSNPDPKMVRNVLLRKITDHKDIYATGTTERNIEVFTRLAKAKTEVLSVKGLVTDARNKGIIVKKADGHYVYGDLKLGKTLKDIEDYLNDKDNIEIKLEITQKIK